MIIVRVYIMVYLHTGISLQAYAQFVTRLEKIVWCTFYALVQSMSSQDIFFQMRSYQTTV